MQYAEDRLRSAEVMHLALGFMGRQDSAFNPFSYTLWYEHCAGLNPSLSRTLEARLAAQMPLTDVDVCRLYAEHVIARDSKVYERLRDELYRILNDIVANIEVAGAQAADAFDQAKAASADNLTESPNSDSTADTLVDLISDTGRIRAVTTELSAKLKASAEQVASLTENLQRAQNEAMLDRLTGLKNRRAFEQAAHELQMQSGGLSGTALIMIDIDHFKSVNDEYGHVVGDRVLHAVAHVLRSNIKGRDVAARYGGEEFAVLLPHTSLSGAVNLAQQMRSLVSHGRIKRTDGRGIIRRVTVSMGVAIAAEGDSLEQLLERADTALYNAKRAGRNRVEAATGSL